MSRPRVNGRRGAFQIVFGAVYIIVGLNFFATEHQAAAEKYFGWLGPVPLGIFAALWVAAGVIAAASAFLARPRDAAGFVAMVFAPGIWLGLFMISAAVTGSAAAAIQGLIYGCFAAAPLIVSGMAGDKDRDHREVR